MVLLPIAVVLPTAVALLSVPLTMLLLLMLDDDDGESENGAVYGTIT